MKQETATVLGFGLVALCVAGGLLVINGTITREAGKINTTIERLPKSLFEGVQGVTSSVFGR
jgi:hypothetical protein